VTGRAKLRLCPFYFGRRSSTALPTVGTIKFVPAVFLQLFFQDAETQSVFAWKLHSAHSQYFLKPIRAASRPYLDKHKNVIGYTGFLSIVAEPKFHNHNANVRQIIFKN